MRRFVFAFLVLTVVSALTVMPGLGSGSAHAQQPGALPATGTGGLQADNQMTSGLLAAGALVLLGVVGSTGLVAYRRSR
jgi:hypothetical protein